MKHIQQIKDFKLIKILADTRRMAILQLLMSTPATLSQLGQVLEEHPARIRHHLKLLEKAGLVVLVETRVVRGFVEKYYRATARAFVLHELILPICKGREVIVMLGSHDLALEILAQRLFKKTHDSLEVLVLPVGSLEGLIALRQGIAQIAGCHLLDSESGEFNTPYVRHLFPDREIAVITLAYREQGLLVASGNPKKIRGLEDLAREDILIVNRNQGSGTRLWLDRQLNQLSISPQAVRGYTREVNTHTSVANTILQGDADVGLGLKAVARQFKLDFIPLFQERFDLVAPEKEIKGNRYSTLFDYMQSAEFRQSVEGLGGYDTSHTGDLV